MGDDEKASELGPRRFTPNQQQGDLGEDDVCRALLAYGWPTEVIKRDLGEDLFVRVYDDGRSAGLMFMIQVKSTSDHAALLDQKKQHLSYGVEVKDLKHWRVQATPVVFVVWDVTTGTGWWVPIPLAIDDLNKRNQEWDGQQGVQIHIPVANRLDAQGLKQLRHYMADHHYPLINPTGEFRITGRFKFPQTEEGRAAQAAYERHHETGEACIIDGKFVEAFTLPEDYRRLYGEPGPDGVTMVSITPMPSDEVTPLRLEIIPTSGTAAAIDYIALRVIRGGHAQVTRTNEDQHCPLLLRIVEHVDGRSDMELGIRWLGHTTDEALRTLDFMRAANTGGEMRGRYLSGSRRTMQTPIPPGFLGAPRADLARRIEVLRAIEARTGCTFRSDSDWSMSRGLAHQVLRLHAILTAGVYHERGVTVEPSFNDVDDVAREIAELEKLADPDAEAGTSQEYPDERVLLYGQTIELGTLSVTTRIPARAAAAQMRAQLPNLAAHTPVTVVLRGVDVEWRSSAWPAAAAP